MKNLFSNLKYDLPASVVVFFVALPLCLGIALASGVPLFAGVIAGIVGGIVVGSISGSSIGVSGPAAGLTAIVFAAIGTLGGYQNLLTAVVISGVIQILFGALRAGVIGYYFPSSVIKGMLTGIGIIIILKQIPHFFGHDPDSEGNLAFLQENHENTFSELFRVLGDISIGSTVIGILSLAVLILWDKVLAAKSKIFKVIQGSLVVVVLGILFSVLFAGHSVLGISPKHLVNVPVFTSFDSFLSQFTTPNFSIFFQPDVWLVAFTIALVGSLETLLCVEATDKIDPNKRTTPTNRELLAQGTGNIISGMVGGLPITQVIVRSSANVQSGGKTKMSAIIHGCLLLAFVILIPALLNKIPLSVLAAILLVVGYKLAKPQLFKQMYQLGWKHFVPFIVTVLGLVFTDLLIGISLGITVGLFVTLINSYQNSHFLHKEKEEKGKDKVKMVLAEEVSFFNKGAILKELNEIPSGAHLDIDIRNTKFLDYDVMEILEDFAQKAKLNDIHVTLFTRNQVIEDPEHYGKFFALNSKKVKTHTQKTQSSLTPEIALKILKEGNKRFVNNLKANRNLLQQVNDTSDGQFPFATILSCIDSRTSAELIFDQGLGDIFSIRIAGNVLNEDILGSMEFATQIAGTKIIVVLGHSQCGAIKGACNQVEMGNLTTLLEKIKPAIDSETETTENRNASNKTFVNNVAEININLTIDRIRKESPIVAKLEEEGKIKIIGAMYYVEGGKVVFYE